MALSIKELGSLVSLLSETSTASHTFEDLANKFHISFSKQEYGKIGTAIMLLLQNHDLLPTATQKLTAIFFLYEMYRTEPMGNNPFASIFLHLLSFGTNPEMDKALMLPRLSIQEKHFLANLLQQQNIRELVKRTPVQVLQTNLPENIPLPDLSAIQAAVAEKQNETPSINKAAMPCIIPAPDPMPRTVEQFGKTTLINTDQQRQITEQLLTGVPAAVERSFKPEFIRLAPPLHYPENEMVWLTPWNHSGDYQISWDYNMCVTTTSEIEAKKLVSKAIKAPLQLQQQRQLLDELNRYPNLVNAVGLTPAKLPGLVENNPPIGFEVLRRLIDQNSSQITEFFSVLVNMQLSLHSMEVVNRLTSSVELPQEFIYLYISNCITTCERIQDKYMQSRLARLVCVFLQSLIRNKIINVKDIFIDVQAFCIGFSHIREAVALFRLLKTLDDNGGDQSAAAAVAGTSVSSSSGPTVTSGSATTGATGSSSAGGSTATTDIISLSTAAGLAASNNAEDVGGGGSEPVTLTGAGSSD